MVGKFNFTGLRDRLHHSTSHESQASIQVLPSHRNSSVTSLAYLRHRVPFIASPLDPKATDWLNDKRDNNNLTLKRRPTVAQYEAGKVAGGLFRKQGEASPLELFFDLFFVANLAVFTYNHEANTAQAVGNYIGFFSILWTFWFHISIHDVRFYVDSQLNRLFKVAQFAIFTAFTGLSPVYNVLSNGGETRAFHGVAFALMASRLILMIQYGVIFWFVKSFKKTLVPLSIMMLIYLAAAMGFLATYLDNKNTELEGAEGVHKVIVWYVIVGVEAVLVIFVSSFWRVLSFKRTHLVERVGLLTLIIMGEGIIGVVKSISYVVDGVTISVWDATGRVIVGVMMIYLVFILYFTPISHDRFGTIRQQVWILLHFPFHLAVLLTEEASSSTLLWMTVVRAREKLKSQLPSLTDPSKGFENAAAFVAKVNETMSWTGKSYTYKKLKEVYDYSPDVKALANLTSEYDYASEDWTEHATEILGEMFTETTNYFFENFHVELPKWARGTTDPAEELTVHFESMQVIYTFFWIAAGAVLICLGLMYWIGKNNKTWEEWVAILTRLTVGLGLPFMAILAWVQPLETGFMYTNSGWIVGIAVFAYLFINLSDNIVALVWERQYKYRAKRGRVDTMDLEDLQKHVSRYNHGAFGPVLDSHDSFHSTSHLHTHSDTTVAARDYADKTARFEESPTQYDFAGAGHDRNDSNASSRQSTLRAAADPDRLHPEHNTGVGRVDTAYRGSGGLEAQRMVDSTDHDDDDDNQNPHRSAVSSLSHQRYSDSHSGGADAITPMSVPSLPRPEDGYHRPETDHQH